MPTSKGRHSSDISPLNITVGVAISIAILGWQHAVEGAKAEAAAGAWGVSQGVPEAARRGMLEARGKEREV